MGDSEARYDPVADWYAERVGAWGDEPIGLLPSDLNGVRMLDLACGEGRVSRWLARHGARVTGVDLSAGLLSHARAADAAEPLGIAYLQGNAVDVRWWDGVPFDGILCQMALMDIDDLHGALSTVATVLAPDGWFTFSIFHPCFPGGDNGGFSGLSSWPPELGYTAEGWWNTDGDGIRGRVGGHHRMLSTYPNAILDADLVLERFAELGERLPGIFLVRCRRPG